MSFSTTPCWEPPPLRESGIIVRLSSQAIVRSATVAGFDRRRDIAVPLLDRDPGVPAMTFKLTNYSNVGETAYVVGFP